MTATARLLFFAGSARAGSHNKKLARLGAMIAEANGIPATFLVGKGGKIVATGTPEDVAKVARSHTGQYLKTLLKNRAPEKPTTARKLKAAE